MLNQPTFLYCMYLPFRLNWKGLSKSQNFYKSIKMHFCLICIYSIKYLISGKCDLDPVAKPQQASNHTIVLVRHNSVRVASRHNCDVYFNGYSSMFVHLICLFSLLVLERLWACQQQRWSCLLLSSLCVFSVICLSAQSHAANWILV